MVCGNWSNCTKNNSLIDIRNKFRESRNSIPVNKSPTVYTENAEPYYHTNKDTCLLVTSIYTCKVTTPDLAWNINTKTHVLA